MSDQKLRDLERRWKETGTVEDEAAYLLERVRVGDLTRERLELAAYCGQEGARRATLGEEAHRDVAVPTSPWLNEWATSLAERWGDQTLLQLAVAVARAGAQSEPDRRLVEFAERSLSGADADPPPGELIAESELVQVAVDTALGLADDAYVAGWQSRSMCVRHCCADILSTAIRTLSPSAVLVAIVGFGSRALDVGEGRDVPRG